MYSNYFLSGWIANLGVVPLFSFAFFLALPVAFSLFFLLIRVCLVREPILNPFFNVFFKLFRKEFLTLMILVVKGISPTNALSSEIVTWGGSEEIFLARGEQTELTLPGLKSFSIGNKQVLTHKHNTKAETLIIKGKAIGFSDLVLWKASGEKSTFRFYVTSKRDQLKKMESLQALKKTSLDISVNGELIIAEGEIRTLKEYFIIKNLQERNSKDMTLNVGLSKELRNHLYKLVYENFLKEGVEFISCSTVEANITCQFKSTFPPASIELFTNKYSIKFNSYETLKTLSNYTLKFQFVTLEGSNSNDISSGLDKIKSGFAQTKNNNQLILETGDIFIQEDDFSSRFVSSQTLKAIIGEKFDLRIGTEIPFKTEVDDQIITEWKFSGLQLKGLLKLKEENILLSYDSELSSPTENGISGPRGKSTVNLSSFEPQIIFTLDIDSQSTNTQGIPIFNEIPVLRSLFQTENGITAHKMVVCILKVERE